MLGLFKEAEAPVARDEAWLVARRLLNSSLNKGLVPTWEQFFQELPVLESAEDLNAIKVNFQRLTEWDFLDEILRNRATEFFFHGPSNSQFLGLDGRKTEFQVELSLEDWQLWLEIISIKRHQNWNVQNPFCSFYGKLFGKDYRFSMVHHSTSPGGVSKLMLRSLSSVPHPLQSFGDTAVIANLVREKKNILVAGSTGSGKTSLLSSLLEVVEKKDHLVILEDTFEIMCSHPHQTRFLAGESLVTSLRSYLTYSLRLSPDRIILGEMRSHEVIPFLMAMNTGHKGLMGTLHASSAPDALNRVALLFTLYATEANLAFEKVMELLCRNLQYVVFMENKKVKEVIKILGSEKGIPFFERIGDCASAVTNERINLF